MLRRALVVLTLVAFVGLAGGCDCDGVCRGDGEVLELDGTLVARNGQVLTFRPADDSRSVRVAVPDDAGLLEIGHEYSVVAIAGLRTDVDWTSQLGGCGCDDVTITNLDGSSIDTGWWARTRKAVPFTLITVSVLALPVATLALVAGHRIIRSGPRQPPLDGVPFDEWVEYDDPSPERSVGGGHAAVDGDDRARDRRRGR